MFTPPDPWKQGDPSSAAHLNQPIPILNSVRSILAAAGTGLTIAQTEQGTTIGVAPATRVGESWIGVIVATGPNGEADYDDARYWVKRQYLRSGGEAFGDDIPPTDGSGRYVDPYPVTAINLAEAAPDSLGTSHLLAVDGTVLVRVNTLLDCSNPPKICHTFSRFGPSGVKFGLATADWTSGNEVTLTPCDVLGVETGEDDITANIFLPPPDDAPANVHILEGDRVAYVELGNDEYLCINVSFGEFTSLGTVQYQVYQMTNSTTAAWDWVRGHS